MRRCAHCENIYMHHAYSDAYSDHDAYGDMVPFRVLLCSQALTLKPLVALLYVIVCLIICFEGIESLQPITVYIRQTITFRNLQPIMNA